MFLKVAVHVGWAVASSALYEGQHYSRLLASWWPGIKERKKLVAQHIPDLTSAH